MGQLIVINDHLGNRREINPSQIVEIAPGLADDEKRRTKIFLSGREPFFTTLEIAEVRTLISGGGVEKSAKKKPVKG